MSFPELLFDKDPIAAAKLNAELTARTHVHQDFLDAVVEGDLSTLARLVEECEESYPLQNYLTLPIAILALTNWNPGVMAILREAWVQETTRVGDVFPYKNAITWGRLAITLCSVEKQKILLDTGFLTARYQSVQGMQSSDPAVFDFWCDAYCVNIDQGASSSNPQYQDVPVHVWQGISYLDFWRNNGKRQSATQLELERRRNRIFGGFLATAYPADSEQARWHAMLARPPRPVFVEDREEYVAKTAALMNYQLDKAPELRNEKVRINLSFVQDAQTAHALLQCGFPVASFENDLVSEAFQLLIKALSTRHNIPEPLSLLWAQIVESLSRDDPTMLDRMPRELTQHGLCLKQLCAKMPDHEKESLRDLLTISVNTGAAANRHRSGPRL